MKFGLQEVGENIWACRTPFNAGVEVTTQMTVVRLPDQSIVLISPVEIDIDLQKTIESLGTVTYIIAPNNFHHLFVQSAKSAFPQAQFLCPPALPPRIKTLPPHQVLQDVDDEIWQGELVPLPLSRSHFADEVVFYHPESKTLIVTDAFQNMAGDMNFGARLFAYTMGTKDGLAVSRVFRVMIRNRLEMKASFKRIIEWDIDHVLLAHNTNVMHDAKKALRDAMAFLLD